MIEPRISLLTLDYPPEKGGVARYLGELVKHSGDRIAVYTPMDHPETQEQYDTRAEFFRAAWPRWWPTVKLCREQAKGNRTVLVSHVFPVGTAAWIARGLGGPEYAVIFHGLDVRLARTSYWKQILLRLVCRSAVALIANSESTKRDLLDLVPGASVTVITPGVDDAKYPTREEARQKLSLSSDEKVVVSVARLVSRKGIDHSLKAMAKIQRNSDVKYVVLGDGEDRERLEKLATEYQTVVTWIRNADDDEKRMWLAAANVFLLPVRDEGDDVEGFGIVYLEAAKAGIASVAGKSGGAVEAVLQDKTGLLVDPESNDEIVAAVDKLLGDKGLREAMGKEGRNRVLKEFQWPERWAKLVRTLGIQL